MPRVGWWVWMRVCVRWGMGGWGGGGGETLLDCMLYILYGRVYREDIKKITRGVKGARGTR